jgi:hypothetical protein
MQSNSRVVSAAAVISRIFHVPLLCRPELWIEGSHVLGAHLNNLFDIVGSFGTFIQCTIKFHIKMDAGKAFVLTGYPLKALGVGSFHEILNTCMN